MAINKWNWSCNVFWSWNICNKAIIGGYSYNMAFKGLSVHERHNSLKVYNMYSNGMSSMGYFNLTGLLKCWFQSTHTFSKVSEVNLFECLCNEQVFCVVIQLDGCRVSLTVRVQGSFEVTVPSPSGFVEQLLQYSGLLYALSSCRISLGMVSRTYSIKLPSVS